MPPSLRDLGAATTSLNVVGGVLIILRSTASNRLLSTVKSDSAFRFAFMPHVLSPIVGVMKPWMPVIFCLFWLSYQPMGSNKRMPLNDNIKKLQAVHPILRYLLHL